MKPFVKMVVSVRVCQNVLVDLDIVHDNIPPVRIVISLAEIQYV